MTLRGITPEEKKRRRGDQLRAAQQRWKLLSNDIDITPYKTSARRKSCRLDLVKFCRLYLKSWFPLPNSPDQIKTLRALQTVILKGGNKAIARPRGTGKTQQTKAATLWAALYRHRRYIVPFAANAKQARKNFQTLGKALAQNPELDKDWPEICRPLRAAFMRPNKAPYVTVNGDPTLMSCGAAKIVFPFCPGVCLDSEEDGVVILECAGVLEAARGLQHDTPEGETIRPDLAIGDDFQTKASAKSASQCETRIETICGDFKHMAGPDKDLAMVLNATVIEHNDAADQLLNRDKHPEFDGERQRMVYEFPKRQDLWKQYVELRRSGMRDGDRGEAANKFYRSHRNAMDDGAVVGWKHGFSKARGERSAIQHAYNILADDGEKVFQAECQNDPIQRQSTQYELTEDLILSRTSGIPRMHAPTGATHIVATIDVNHCGLNWTVFACRPDAAAYLTAYGKHPEHSDMIDRKKPRGISDAQVIADELGRLLEKLNAMQIVVDGKPRFIGACFVDCGFMRSTILKTISGCRFPMPVHAVRGISSSRFRVRKDAFRHGDNWQIVDVPDGRVLEINSDHWREVSQRAFFLSPGTAGSIAVYGTEPGPIKRYAMEVASEKLADKVQSEGGNTFYKWASVPGVAHDLGDCTTYAIAAANVSGADVANAEKAWRPPAATAPDLTRPAGPAPRVWRKPSRTPARGIASGY